MITQETAGKIWNAYREIEVSEKLLSDMAEAARVFDNDVRRETVKDAFGRRRQLTLGIPNGDSSQRILDVDPGLAKCVIVAHIAEKRTELVAMNELARIEVGQAE